MTTSIFWSASLSCFSARGDLTCLAGMNTAAFLGLLSEINPSVMIQSGSVWIGQKIEKRPHAVGGLRHALVLGFHVIALYETSVIRRITYSDVVLMVSTPPRYWVTLCLNPWSGFTFSKIPRRRSYRSRLHTRDQPASWGGPIGHAENVLLRALWHTHPKVCWGC